MAFWSWSRTANNNATADSTINYQEGQAPSSLNDSARAAMARLAEYRDDISGAIVTAGTSTGYTVSSYQGFDTLAHLANQMIAFTPHVTNGATVTLNVDSLGAKPLRTSPGVELQAGTIIQGTPYVATYNNSDGAWYLQGFTGNPYNIPLAGGMDFWGTTVPNSGFAFPIGQAISRTTYATLFAIMGTTYGVGDGSTTFNLPDKTGRVSAMKETVATRLTTAGGGVDGGTMGSAAGAQVETLVTANLPPYTPTGVVTPNAGGPNPVAFAAGLGAVAVTAGGSVAVYPVSGTFALTTSLAMNPMGGTSTPIVNVQPTIVCNYILRII